MTDIELINLASKASGIEYTNKQNPLVSDELALRLAVKLGLVVDVGPVSVSVHKNNGNRDLGFEFYNTGKDDPYATTRRAIVRAAAEIGKEMK